MAIFKTAVAKVLLNEGGYVDNPKDLGGTTNYGISLRFLQTIDKTATKDSIKNLTKEKAEEIYFANFWLPNSYDEIKSQKIADNVFDTAVNVGAKVANRFLQQTLNIIIFNGNKLNEDGIIAKHTLDTVNLLTQEDVDDSVLRVYGFLQKEYYAKIVINRPEQLYFLKGWFKRADK